MTAGATTSIDRLLQLRHHSHALSPGARTRALSHLAGDAKTLYRGRGLDFEEVRHYQPGDELRAIDWRVTARTNVPHTKLFREERERPVLVVVDQRQSMGFGSRNCFKSVQAAELAALICWASLNQQDRIGGLIFNDSEHEDWRPARSRSAVLRILHSIEKFNHLLIVNERNSSTTKANPKKSQKQNNKAGPAASQLDSMLQEVRRIARPGTSVFILSDLIGLDRDGIKQLYQIARHNDVHVLFISDPMEQHLPRLSRAYFTDGEKRLGMQLGSNNLRAEFTAQFDQRVAGLKRELLGAGIPMIPVNTSDDAIDTLNHYYTRGRQLSAQMSRTIEPLAFNTGL